MKLLLHTCCAPCLIYPLERLREENYEVVCFFYNPNIQPLAEYKNRAQAVEGYAFSTQCGVIFSEYKPEEFFRAVYMQEVAPLRCNMCWGLRLEKTARVAKEKGFELFSTTLLVSPYQDQSVLIQLGKEVAAREGIEFYSEDFRPGFRKAHAKAHAQGIYCQKYCGCIYSEIERYSKKSDTKKISK